ncbi:MAG: ABC transporter ATP-binding protein [Aquificae bacterium]|nr:ABC transporter ATP-binding protein [Aquificota bacterium]
MNEKKAVVTQNLEKIYHTKTDIVHALKGISIQIQKGNMVAVMGPSGSGKSTFLHLLGGLDRPTKGKVYIDETDIFSLSDNQLAKFRNQKIGFVFQFHYLLPELTALENVLVPVKLYQKNKTTNNKAYNLLKELGLEKRIDHLPSQLSGGEQQRVAIARAIINSPDIILADEPTGNLDSKNTQKVMNILKELNEKKNTTIVIATHDKEVAKYCKYILHMKDGKIVNKESIS